MDINTVDRSLQDKMFYERAVWYIAFAWLPKRCALSGSLIWLKRAYRGTAWWSGPGLPVFERRWATKEQFLLAKIKGTL